MTIRKWAAQMRGDERGGVLLTGLAGLMALTTVTGGAVDFARYANANRQMANAADAALLSAAAVARARPIDDVAREFFDANFPDAAQAGVTLTSFDIETDTANLEWSANVTADLDTMFLQLVGIDHLVMDHEVRVVWDINKRMEAVFLVDASASMCMDVVRSDDDAGAFVMSYRPDYRCEKLNAMKRAMEYVIENGLSALHGGEGPAFYAGIIPFNHKVNFPNKGRIPAPLLAGETGVPQGDPNYFRNIDDAAPLSPMVPLTPIGDAAAKQRLLDSIDNIRQSPEGLGWTRSNVAALTAALMLDPEHYESFGGARPNEFDVNQTDKVVVMMTDGANVGCCFAAFPNDPANYENQYLYLYQSDNAHLLGIDNMPEVRRWKDKYRIPEEGLCEQMKEAGIVIYSVIYDVDDRDPGGAEIKEAYRECASNEQFFFDVAGEDDLQLAYKTIAQSFLRLRIDY